MATKTTSTSSLKRRSASSSEITAWSSFTHPVDRYARRVLGDFSAGRPILAGPLVRLACLRHLRDRASAGGRRGLTFDSARADHAIDFIQRYVRLAGDVSKPQQPAQLFVLQPWQVFIVGSLFGWLGRDGYRRFRTAYIETGKGSGKTPLAAAIGLYGLIADGEPAAEIYTAANTLKQAKTLFGDAERMVEASPALRRRIDATVNNLAYHAAYAFFRPVSSEKKGLDGPRPHIALIDEVHEHATALVVEKIRAGTKGRRQALIVLITNSGFDRTSVCWYLHEYSRKIAERVLTNNAWFAYVCALDEHDDPLTDERCWPKVNPNLGVSITVKYLREQVREARGRPDKVNLVLRLNFCVWTQVSQRAIDMRRWLDCPTGDVPEADLVGAPCFGGLDLGQTDDFSAWVCIWLVPDGRVAVRCRFWIPEIALAKYPNRPYDVWRRAGVIEVTEGDTTDYDRIESTVAADCEQWGVREVAYDKRFAEQLAQHLQGFGITMTNQPQGFPLSEATGRLLELITRGELWHGHHEVLTFMASNLVVRFGPGGLIRPDKERAPEKIDGIVALIMAIARAIVVPPEAESAYVDHPLVIV